MSDHSSSSSDADQSPDPAGDSGTSPFNDAASPPDNSENVGSSSPSPTEPPSNDPGQAPRDKTATPDALPPPLPASSKSPSTFNPSPDSAPSSATLPALLAAGSAVAAAASSGLGGLARIPPRVDPNALATKSLLQAARQCRHCQYSLQGLPRDSLCPECGTPVMDSLNPEDLDASAQVTFERKCRQCSYELLGLPLTANCPECGTPVRESIRADELRHSSLDYLKTLRNGLGLAALSAVMAIVDTFLPVILMFTFGFLSSTTIVGTGIWLAFHSILGGASWWMVTQPDNACPPQRDVPQVRLWLRIGVVATITFTAGRVMMQAFLLGNPAAAAGAGLVGGPAQAMIANGVVNLAQFAATVLWLVTAMIYIRWIALRLPNLALANNARVYTWLLPTIHVVLCLCIGPFIAQMMLVILLLMVASRVSGLIKYVQTSKPQFALAEAPSPSSPSTQASPTSDIPPPLPPS